MINLRITNGFDKLPDPALLTKSNSIYNCIVANAASFPASTPSMSEFRIGIDNYANSLADSEQGGTSEIDRKDEMRDVLIGLLHKLSNYVLFVSTSEAMARLSGFTVAKTTRTPAPAVTPATEQALSDGPNKGDIDYRFKPVPGARSYVYQCTPHPITDASVWEHKAGTVSKVRFSGIPSGQRTWFRVMAIGRSGQAVYSEPVSRIAQ